MKKSSWNWLWIVVCLWLMVGTVSAAFPDVPEESWYAQAVEEMEAEGLLSGYPDGSFHPSLPISAAQFVAIAARCAELEPVQGQANHWASGFMQAALQAGWYDWDEIPPDGARFDQPISRQLAVKILMRSCAPDIRGDYLAQSAKIKDFSQLDGRYYEPVLAAYEAGVVSGDNQGNFHPTAGLSRAEACILFQNVRKLAGTDHDQPGPVPAVTAQGGVSEHGWLQVIGTQLCSEAGNPVVLRGMSSHGLQWYGQYANRQAIGNTAQWGANVFRVAVYTEEGGYLTNPNAICQAAIDAADAAVANDMYVILDWHILSDGNPMEHLEDAKAFFSAMAQRFGENPAVLYEICNEPNGAVSWEQDIKPYAQQIIAVIREYAPRSVILVGSSTWSQDIHLAAQSPLAGKNLMYTLHFYAGTHGAQLRQRLDEALRAGLPVFISEWGTSRADGSGGVFLGEAAEWLDFLEQRGISWVNWSLCDKNETSAALRPGTSPSREWTQADLSESGRFVFEQFGLK